jgi:hypothetical protein
MYSVALVSPGRVSGVEATAHAPRPEAVILPPGHHLALSVAWPR